MKNVLLLTDFSENSWNAIKYAIGFHEETACNFFLLHASRVSHLTIANGSYLPDPESIEKVYIRPAKAKLLELQKRIAEHISSSSKHKFYTISDYNFLVQSVRDLVERKNIELIVLGAKGTSSLKQTIVGSNTRDIITKVACTTLAVPEKAIYTKIKELAFPTDFALQYNLNTLEPILKIIQENNAILRVVHISKQAESVLNSDQIKNKELLEDYFQSHTHSFHFLTNKNIEAAVQFFVKSRHVDMLTMVAKNLNYFQQILFHSKVEKINYHIHIPFLVVHN